MITIVINSGARGYGQNKGGFATTAITTVHIQYVVSSHACTVHRPGTIPRATQRVRRAAALACKSSNNTKLIIEDLLRSIFIASNGLNF